MPPGAIETAGATAVSVAMIQALIPLGLRAVEETLQAEVAALAGPPYAREDIPSGVARCGAQPGSVYLADQKQPIAVPRVREVCSDIAVQPSRVTRKGWRRR